MEKKTEREKMMDRNGIRKQKKRGLRKGSKNQRMHNLVRGIGRILQW